jgi:hypothetical protein
LIELVVSSGLMALILISGYLCLSSGMATQKLVESRGETLQGARVALRMMTADLRAACPLSRDMEFIGINRTLDGVDADNVDFGTHHYTAQRAGEGDFCQMSYFVAREPGTGIHALWRRRHPGFGVNPLAGGERDEILRGLRGLKLEYYDGFEWFETWGDPDGRAKKETSFRFQPNLRGLPEAVRITLWVGPERSPAAGQTNETDSPIVLQTVARLQLAGRVSTGGSSSGSSNTSSENGAKSQADSPNPAGNPE